MAFRLYLLQRVTALMMIPLVIGHIAVMIYAIQDGLSAAEILGRTQGSTFWAAFYGLFVVTVSIHAAIGLRTVVAETFGVKGGALDAFAWTVFATLLAMGGHAVYAVTVGPAA